MSTFSIWCNGCDKRTEYPYSCVKHEKLKPDSSIEESFYFGSFGMICECKKFIEVWFEETADGDFADNFLYIEGAKCFVHLSGKA